MQKLLTTKIIGKAGLNTDMPAWELAPEFISEGNNFRVRNGAIESFGGYTFLKQSVNAFFSAGKIFHYKTTQNDSWVVGTQNNVWSWDGGTTLDLATFNNTVSGDQYGWTFSAIGQVLFANHTKFGPHYWRPFLSENTLTPLPFITNQSTWQDLGYTCEVMRSHKNFLFALNIDDNVGKSPDGYRWSAPADENSYPFTWDEDDNSSLAGRAQLGGDGGGIVDGLPLRDSFVIYSHNAIDILDFTGDEFVWRRREMSRSYGLLCKDAVVEVKGKHFFISNGDILVNDGNSIQSIAHNRISDQFNAAIDPDNYRNSYVVKHDDAKEVWFCIPTVGNETANVAYIYNWKDDTWAIRDLPDNCAHAAYGTQSTPTGTWDESTISWDNTIVPWNTDRLTPINDTIVGVQYDNNLIVLDPSDGNEIDVDTFLLRTDYPMDGDRQVTSVTRAYPHCYGPQEITVEFGSQQLPGGPVDWAAPVQFKPQVERKVDLRTTGELITWRVSSLGKDKFKLSGFSVEYVPAGLR